jgi:uncharacterized protein
VLASLALTDETVTDVQIYLPIAGLPVDVFTVLGLSVAVGFISGLFGVGGGFLMTPLLIFLGIPPAVAVASVSSQIAASSVTGALAYWRRRAVDFKLGTILTLGGIVGAVLGVVFFNAMRRQGHLDAVIVFSYIALLGSIGGLMLFESLKAILFPRMGDAKQPLAARHGWAASLPFKMQFHHSGLEISTIPLFLLAVFIGFFGALLGVGGGFILVPALIYIFRVPTAVVLGTSLVQQLITMVIATFLHAATNHSVDILLSLILMLGATFGAQFGARAHISIRPDYFRLLLGLLVFGVALRFAADVLIPPRDTYSATRTDVAR